MIVLTGPSGVGKDAVVNRARELGIPLERPATMTTRAPRPGEIEGVHHLFVSREQFRQHITAGELLEHAEVYGNLYGVPRSSVRDALATGAHVVIRVDVQGAESLRTVLPGALFISLEPSDHEALRRHLEERATESPGEVKRRLTIAIDEMERARRFCRPLVNVEGDLDATVADLVSVIEAEQARAGRVPIQV